MFLGILITFAQFEREVTGERIRDKLAAAKRRGKYCRGVPILGYDIDRDNKKLPQPQLRQCLVTPGVDVLVLDATHEPLYPFAIDAVALLAQRRAIAEAESER